MIEMLDALCIHAMFTHAKQYNYRIGPARARDMCVHGRATTQTCYRCAREIAEEHWNRWQQCEALS